MVNTSGEQTVNLPELATNTRAKGSGEGHKKTVQQRQYPSHSREGRRQKQTKAARRLHKGSGGKKPHWKKSTEEGMRTGMAEQRKKGIQGQKGTSTTQKPQTKLYHSLNAPFFACLLLSPHLASKRKTQTNSCCDKVYMIFHLHTTPTFFCLFQSSFCKLSASIGTPPSPMDGTFSSLLQSEIKP